MRVSVFCWKKSNFRVLNCEWLLSDIEFYYGLMTKKMEEKMSYVVDTIVKELVKTVVILVYLALNLFTSLSSTGKNTEIVRSNAMNGVELRFIYLVW